MDEIENLIGPNRAEKYIVVLALESFYLFIQAYEIKKLCVDHRCASKASYTSEPYHGHASSTEADLDQVQKPRDKHNFYSRTSTPLWRGPSCGYPSSQSAKAPFRGRPSPPKSRTTRAQIPSRSKWKLGLSEQQAFLGLLWTLLLLLDSEAEVLDDWCTVDIIQLVVDVYQSMRLEGNNIWILVDVWLWCSRGGTWMILGKQLLNCLLYYIGGRYYCLRCSPLINEFMQSWRYKARVGFERVLKGLPYCHWGVLKEHAKGTYNRKRPDISFRTLKPFLCFLLSPFVFLSNCVSNLT